MSGAIDDQSPPAVNGAGRVVVRENDTAAFDQPIVIKKSGLSPHSDVTVEVGVVDALGLSWTGSGRSKADARGHLSFDLSEVIAQIAPADGAALITRATERADLGMRPAPDPDGGLTFTVDIKGEGGEAWTQLIRRHLEPAGIVAEMVREEPDVRGLLFKPLGGAPRAGVLLFAGSGGGIDRNAAALLAGQGYAVFAQALFAYDDLQPHMFEIPVERIGRGLAFMAERFAGVPLVLRGISKGSEGVAHAALAYPDLVNGLVLWVPSPMATTGRGAEPGPRPLYTIRNEVIPYGIPPFADVLDDGPWDADAPLALAPVFERMWTDPAFDRFRLRFEKITCPLLLVSGDDDRIWPSELASRQIAERAKPSGVLVRHVQNSDAGHGFNVPGLSEAMTHIAFHPRQRMWLALGGTPLGNGGAAWRSWRAMLDFLAMIAARGHSVTP
ncbi:MAG: acyl-CoA thioester hydrolase/BAAT C-terminal domain-containing protein [Pseudomonadota bacterium]